MTKKSLFIVLLFSLPFFFVLPVAYGGAAKQTLWISGASTIQPLAEKIAEIHTKEFGEKVVVRGGGSAKGIKDGLSGASDIGMVSRALKPEEKVRLKQTTVGYDAVAIIVSKNNPLTDIKKDALIGLFNGRIKNWGLITTWNMPVVIVSKQPGRSTLELFENYSGLRHFSKSNNKTSFKADEIITRDAYEIGSNLEAATLVGGMPNTIGYVSLGTAQSLIRQGMPIKMLTIDGIAATKETVLSGKYPIIRELNLVYIRGYTRVNEYINIFLSAQGQKVVEEFGFITAKKEKAK
ncbi:MAG: phosphate ABC transporter substrate-binding protein [Nitrospirae bacterium]|nr:phosphate ABC transporter substrate-binding protein [Nitrospirota bacterium]